MEKPDLERIVREIKSRGLTAYQISKDLPISEVGINKILNGESKKPQKSTLLLLHNYLFNNVEQNQKETPPEEARFEDIVAKKVLDHLLPKINELNRKIDLIAETSTSVDVGLERIQERVDDTFKEVIKLK